MAIVVRNQIDGKTQVAKSSRSPDSMKVGFTVFGEVKVDDNIDGLNIYTSCEEICRRKEGIRSAPSNSILDALIDRKAYQMLQGAV